jgi:antirestriction protein ArdC
VSDTQSPSRDYRQEVTDKIISLLEEGVAPWQKPWDATGMTMMPMNPTTLKPYRGGNALYLMIRAIEKDYDDPRWATYKQSQDNKWQVRKGEKGTQIEYWEKKAPTDKGEAPEDGQEDSEPTKSRWIHRVYTVFNARQIDGIPAFSPKRHTPFEAVEAGETILANSGAAIHHDQAARAYYSRLSDDIHLPKREYFKDGAGYYGTALHELAHWSGHPSRLDRPTLNESYSFGDTHYAQEELRAELTSLFLAAERGIPHDPDRHAAYVASWIKSLKDDKNEIFRAAHDASEAADYLLALERGLSHDPKLISPPALSL